MRWIVTLAVLVPFFFVILTTSGVWPLSFGVNHILPGSWLAVPMTIWISIGIMVFIVSLTALAVRLVDFDED